LRKYLKLERHCEETAILKRRVGPFLVDNEKRKRLSIQIGNDEHARERRVFAMPKSCKNGHFECELTISDEELKEFMDEYPDHLLHFRAVTEQGDERVFEGVAHLIDNEGWSVISDIDDTVKLTHVGSTRKLLRSTFMEEFQEVDGMAEKYREWANDLNAKFHFVSSSPWQLWEEIDIFLRRSGFPLATYHLKPIRLKDRTLFDLWKDPVKTKTDTVQSILEEYPHRLFALVGDTGEKDPEVYGEMTRRFPQRIQGIFLRNVTNDKGTEERYQLAFEGVDPSLWKLFNDPKEMELAPEVVEAFAHTHPNTHINDNNANVKEEKE
jgi:phosphatidate phosphatase APP1